MTEQAIFFPEPDRRSGSSFNRIRRFINNYWLIPVLICYLQLATQAIYPGDPPLERLTKGNNAFLKGIPIAYKIATDDFPYTLLGHFYEIGTQVLYKSQLLQVSHDDIKAGLSAPGMQTELYRRLIASRTHRESELGGILSLSYSDGAAKLHFHAIPSLNEGYLIKLRNAIDSPRTFRHLLESEGYQEILESVGIQKRWAKDTLFLMQNQNIPHKSRRMATENFVDMFSALSESRYLLSPYQLKNALGKLPLKERFVGLFHFHNGLNEPPSSVDTQQSMRKRQVVLTVANEGWTLYDLVQREASKIDIEIDKQIRLQ